MPGELEAWSLNPWTTREVPLGMILICIPLIVKGADHLFFFFNNYFYLPALGLSCSMWDLVPWPGIEPGPLALGAQRLSHRTTREVPRC